MSKLTLHTRIRFLKCQSFALDVLYGVTKQKWFFERKIAIGILLLSLINLATTNRSDAQDSKQNKSKNSSIEPFSPSANSQIPDATPVDPPAVKPVANDERNIDVTCYIIDDTPIFPGGDIAEYLARNIIYPPKAIAENQEGRVIVQVTINSTGHVISPKVVKGICAELDSEALRVVRLIPRWIPGKARNKAIGMRYTLPINFRLPSQKK